MSKIDYQHSELRKRVMSSLRKQNVYSPVHPGAVDEDGQFPTDITALSDIEVRQLMSFWTAQLGYIITYHARCVVDVTAYKRAVRDYERAYRASNRQKNDKAWEVDAGLANDTMYQSLSSKHEHADALVTITKSLKDTFEQYYAAASREMTARLGEFGREISTRSGT